MCQLQITDIEPLISESRQGGAATSSSLQELGMLEISFLMYLIALPMLADRGRH